MKMTFRWYGEKDPITLEYIRQIPSVSGVRRSRRSGLEFGENRETV